MRIVPRVFIPTALLSKFSKQDKNVVRLAIVVNLKENEQLPHLDDVAHLVADDNFEDADIPMHIKVIPPHGVVSRDEGVVILLTVPAEFADRISASVSFDVPETVGGDVGDVLVAPKESNSGNVAKDGSIHRTFASFLARLGIGQPA